jgi:hypothetical protein
MPVIIASFPMALSYRPFAAELSGLPEGLPNGQACDRFNLIGYP